FYRLLNFRDEIASLSSEQVTARFNEILAVVSKHSLAIAGLRSYLDNLASLPADDTDPTPPAPETPQPTSLVESMRPQVEDVLAGAVSDARIRGVRFNLSDFLAEEHAQKFINGAANKSSISPEIVKAAINSIYVDWCRKREVAGLAEVDEPLDPVIEEI